jgi:hypothetical protein
MALKQTVAWFAFGAAMFSAPILSDMAFNLALLEGGTMLGGDATHILIVIAAAAATILGMVICLWAAWHTAWSLIMSVRERL